MVFEIDPRRVAFLQARRARCRSCGRNRTRTICANRSRRSFSDSFDSFETDPPYTIAGATLFVRRGVELLERGRGYGMLSFGHTSPPDRLKLQAALTSLGVVTTALYPGFNSYAGASILGSTSELHELIATGVMAASEPNGRAPLYTAEVNPRIRHLRMHAMQSPLEARNGCDPADHRGAEGDRLPGLRKPFLSTVGKT